MSTLYVNSMTLLRWRCAIGHEWFATLNSIRNKRSWCPTCSRNARLSLDDARRVAFLRGGSCLSQDYTNSRELLLWKCAKGHQWKATLDAVKNAGTWCPRCRLSKCEDATRSIFEQIFPGRSFPNCRPTFLIGEHKRRLELDGFCSTLNLAFEYQGEHHYDPKHFWNRKRKDAFVSIVRRDQLKVQLCNVAGVRLVVVPHMARDRLTFIRMSLLRWFPVSQIFPALLSV